MIRITAVAVLATALAVSCATTVISGDDQQVISAVIGRLCEQNKSSGYYVLSSSSESVDPAFTPKGFDESARTSLLKRNRGSEVLPLFRSCDDLRRVDQLQLDADLRRATRDGVLAGNQWSAFYAKFPDSKGVIRLSLPDYSDLGDIAIVQVSVTCGDVCGSVFFWVLRRASDRWEVDRSVPSPVS